MKAVFLSIQSADAKIYVESADQLREEKGYDITVVSTSILGGRQLVIKEGDLSAPAIKDTDKLFVGKVCVLKISVLDTL